MLRSEEIRDLSRINAWQSTFWVAFTWLLIAVTFAAPALYPYWWVYVLAILLMARHQLSLAILMHDAAHMRLYKNITWNDYIGQLFLASPVLFSLTAYRTFHLRHHKDPLTPDDPDISLTGGYPIPWQSFARKLMRDLSGLSYFKFLKYFISKSRTEKGRSKRGGRRKGPSFKQVAAMMLVSNLAIFGALAFSGHPWHYPLLWLLPAVTVLQVYLRIRGVAEHAGYQPNKDQRLNTRTIICPWQTFFVGPNNVNYHIEHHIYPGIPWYNLKKVHRLLRERDSLPAGHVYSGYGRMLREILY